MITRIDEKSALVLIDMQKGTTAGLPAKAKKQVLKNIIQLQDAFRKAGQTVIIVHVEPTDDLFTKIRIENSNKQKNNQEPSPDFAELLSEITVEKDDIVIIKHVWNAFFETRLNELLKEKEITQIVLTGVSTSIGVEGTARAAAELGYNIIFVTDAMTDSVPEAQERSIQYIFPRLGEIGNTEDVINYLNS